MVSLRWCSASAILKIDNIFEEVGISGRSWFGGQF